MSIEFRNLIDKEELLMDTKNLKQFTKHVNEHDNIIKKIDKVRNNFSDKYSEWYDLDIIYRFAEALKKEFL